MLKFSNHSNASKWVAAASKKETYNVLDSASIAKLLLSEQSSNINTTCGFDGTSTEMVKKFLENYSDALRKTLFVEGEYELIMAYMGITIGEQSQQNELKPKEKVLQLKAQIESQQVPQTKDEPLRESGVF